MTQRTTPTRSQRSPQVIRQLLLDAAWQVFGERGYPGATTKEIAERAGVAEGLLFRHFTSKAILFEEAVVRPMTDLIEAELALIEENKDDWTVADLARHILATLYDVFAENRDLMIAMVAAGTFGSTSTPAGAEFTFRPYIARMVAVAEHVGMTRQQTLLQHDILLLEQIALAMVLGLAVFDPLIMPTGSDRPSRDQVIDAVTKFTLFGIAGGVQPDAR